MNVLPPIEGGDGPLAGTVVIDLTRALAGPHATMMLGDLGATVLKIETPDGGDDTRAWGPPFVQPASGDRESTYFLSANRNKRSITLDLKSEDDRTTLRRMLRSADVLVENFRVGVLARLGFPVDELQAINPGLVILSITGFGHDGPEADRSGYDQIAQGEAGLMSLTGSGPDDPQKVGTPIGDILAGMYGAYGVLAALLERERTGRGQVVRTSLLAAVVGVHGFQGTRYTVAGQVGHADGNHHPSICPYGLFRCRDGAVQIAVGSDGLWKRLCAATGLDPYRDGMATNGERVTRRSEVIAMVEGVFRGYDVEDLLTLLRAAQIPAGQVKTLDQVYAAAQTLSQGLLERQANGQRIGADSLRVARRGMRLAQELRLPLVTVVDTPGGELSRHAEEGGLAGEIAGCLSDLSAMTVPTLCVLLGEGTGGVAIALSAARRTIAATHAWLAPLSPEGASTILFRTTAEAARTATRHRIDSTSLVAAGLVDHVVDERPDAADEPAAFAHRLARAIERELAEQQVAELVSRPSYPVAR